MLKPILVGSALAITAAQQLRIHRLKKNNAKITKNNYVLGEMTTFLGKQVTFLATKLDDSDVEITEFDKIAFHNL